MAKINDNKIKIIKDLYTSGYSAKDIASELNETIDAVYYFFRKHNIKRRNRREARNTAYKRKKPSYSLKKNLTSHERELKIAGVMLYWGEGSKWPGEKIVDFANSDLLIVLIFLKFLRIICGIDERKLRVYLYCYKNQDPDSLVKYWSKNIKISPNQFTKPYIRKDYKYSKKGKMKYGLVHIRYADKKLLDQIRIWIEEYGLKFA